MADQGPATSGGARTASRASRAERSRLRFADWPLRVKMAVLLGVASLLPLVIATSLGIRTARWHLLAATQALLGARAEQLADRLNAFDLAHRHSAERLASLPELVAACQRDGKAPAMPEAARTLLETWPREDELLSGISLLDGSGAVVMATDARLQSQNLAALDFVHEALAANRTALSELFRPPFLADAPPVVAYASPVHAVGGRVVGAVVLWVRAESLWTTAKAANALAGANSFAILVDRYGVRIAHSVRDPMVFHPTGPLAPAVLAAQTNEQRFGATTSALLSDVRPFPELFERAGARIPDQAMFRGYAPGGQAWCYGVARRLARAPWTLFYLVPEQTVEEQIAAIARARIRLAVGIVLAALLAGALFARGIVRPVTALSGAIDALAAGDLSARAPEAGRRDELGALGAGFNAMAARLQEQTVALEAARAELASRVKTRTAELQQATWVGERIQARLTALYDAGILGIIVATLGGRVLEINDALLGMLGYTHEEIVSGAVPWRDLTPPEWREQDQQAIASLRASGSTPLRRKEYLHKDGSRVRVLVGSTLLPGPRGETISFVLGVSGDEQPAPASDRRR